MVEQNMDTNSRLEKFWSSEFKSPVTAIQRDLFLNLNKILNDSSLNSQEAFSILLAVSVTVQSGTLQNFAVEELKAQKIPSDLIQEAAEAAAIMAMNNTYYKFRSYTSDDKELGTSSLYPRTGLRMQSLSNPQNEKYLFELLQLSVSILNSCSICVKSHEKKLLELKVEVDKIHDTVRLTAIAKAIATLKIATSI